MGFYLRFFALGIAKGHASLFPPCYVYTRGKHGFVSNLERDQAWFSSLLIACDVVRMHNHPYGCAVAKPTSPVTKKSIEDGRNVVVGGRHRGIAPGGRGPRDPRPRVGHGRTFPLRRDMQATEPPRRRRLVSPLSQAGSGRVRHRHVDDHPGWVLHSETAGPSRPCDVLHPDVAVVRHLTPPPRLLVPQRHHAPPRPRGAARRALRPPPRTPRHAI